MRGHGCQDEDGGDGVETEVEDRHSHLQPSAPLPPGISKHCDCERLSQNTLHQTNKGHLRQEPFEENEDKKRNGKDERNGKGSPIKTGTYEKIPPSPLKRMEEFVLTKPLRRVVLSNFKGGPPKSILYFVSMNWLIIASALFSIFVNSCRPLLVN